MSKAKRTQHSNAVLLSFFFNYWPESNNYSRSEQTTPETPGKQNKTRRQTRLTKEHTTC